MLAHSPDEFQSLVGDVTDVYAVTAGVRLHVGHRVSGIHHLGDWEVVPACDGGPTFLQTEACASVMLAASFGVTWTHSCAWTTMYAYDPSPEVTPRLPVFPRN